MKKLNKIKKETKIFILIWVVILISIGIMFLTMYSPTSKNSTNNLNKINGFKSIVSGNTDTGNIEIKLTPHKIENSKMIVDFLLTTHSVETKGFDLKQITKLEIDGKTFKPISVPTLNGHHNSGEIIFEIGNIKSKKFKIIIEKIPSVNLREFNWNK